jgi:hypothetical protein
MSRLPANCGSFLRSTRGGAESNRSRAPARGERLKAPMIALSRLIALGPASWIVGGLAAAAVTIAMAVAVGPAGAQTQDKPIHSHKKPTGAPDLNADGTVPDRVVEAGKQTNVAIVWDCALPTLAPVVSARVEHGSVAITTGAGPSCGRPQMSLTKIFYTPVPGFKGTDKLHVLGFLVQGNIDETLTILVK